MGGFLASLPHLEASLPLCPTSVYRAAGIILAEFSGLRETS